jgi:group I intron endonuclease
MQSAWLKHGESAFMFMVLEDTSIESLIDREQYHINIKQPYVRSIGFNIAHVTGSSLGVKHSTKTRQRISGLMQGKSRSEESNRLTSESMRGHVVSNETRRKLSERHREKRPSDATIASVSKTWIFTDPNGVEQTVVGAISFCKEHGLDANRMYEVAGGKRTNYKGWRCRKA